jgi:hypothetical protein
MTVMAIPPKYGRPLAWIYWSAVALGFLALVGQSFIGS